jgi:serine/threonine protein kinase
MAPELFEEHGSASFASDVYSFGITLYELVTGEIPFESMTEAQVIMAVMQGKRPTIPAQCDVRLVKLIEMCWQHNAQQRPSTEEIIQILDTLENELCTSTPSPSAKPAQRKSSVSDR